MQFMTRDHILLVQQSFEHVAPSADAAAALFYRRLFELDPALRSLFPGDLQEQQRKLMTMLGVAVRGLDRLETIVPAVQKLGERHRGYGVTDDQYTTVGAALLWTLEQGLGARFTPEVRAAWASAYALLSEHHARDCGRLSRSGRRRSYTCRDQHGDRAAVRAGRRARPARDRQCPHQLHAALANLGGTLEAPFMALSFLALPVIPRLKITDKGLVDVDRFDRVPLWADDDLAQRGSDRRAGPASSRRATPRSRKVSTRPATKPPICAK
jgi:nitric oxide dioxygenase